LPGIPAIVGESVPLANLGQIEPQEYWKVQILTAKAAKAAKGKTDFSFGTADGRR